MEKVCLPDYPFPDIIPFPIPMSRYVEFLFSIALIAACLWVNLTQYPVVWEMLDSENLLLIGRDEEIPNLDEDGLNLGEESERMLADGEIDNSGIGIPESISATSEAKYADSYPNVPIPPAPKSEEIEEKTIERRFTKRIPNPAIPPVTRE